jgi:hypothetical protein
VADVVLTELTLVASDPLTVYIAEALRKRGGEHIAYVRQEHKKRDNENQ